MAGSSSEVLHHVEQLQTITHVKDTVCRFANALDEVTRGIHIFDRLQPSRTVPPSISEKMSTMTEITKSFRDRLLAVLDDVKLSSSPFLIDSMFAT